MKKFLAAFITGLFIYSWVFCGENALQANLSEHEKESIIKKANNLKLPWIENNGRHDTAVAYYTGMDNGNIYVTRSGEIVYQTVYKTEGKGKSHEKYGPPKALLNNGKA